MRTSMSFCAEQGWRKIRAKLGILLVCMSTISLLVLIPNGSVALAAPPGNESIDEVFDSIADSVPSFGGAYVLDESDTLVIVLTEKNDRAANTARKALRSRLGTEIDRTNMEIELGSYSFSQLKQWYDHISMNTVEGLVLTDIDEMRNRILIGVQDVQAAEGGINETLSEAGIPREAVLIESKAPIFQKTSLQSYHRPLVGGLRISQGNVFFYYVCTLGFIANRAGVRGSVTNSHCSEEDGQVDQTLFWQPDVSIFFADYFGEETVDPAFFTGGTCPSGKRCRYSDANFIEHYANCLTCPWDSRSTLGRIARPPLGSTSWNGSNTYRITAEATTVSVGSVVSSVGQTSGLSNGTVTNSCVAVDVSGTDIQMLCQYIAGYSSNPGDSGAPVFRLTNSPSTNDVDLSGINWGGPEDGSSGVFSKISWIESEVGSLDTCYSGFSC